MALLAFKTGLKTEVSQTPFLSSFRPWPERTCALRCPVYLLVRALQVQPVGFPCPPMDCELPRSTFSLSPMASTLLGPSECLFDTYAYVLKKD